MIARSFNKFLQKQSRAIYLGLLIAVIAGLVGLTSLPSGIYPEVIFPRVVILVESGDMAAQLLLPAVTRPIEESVSKIPGFRQVRSQTMRGTVETSVLFSNETDVELALQQVRGRVGELRSTFPVGSNVTIERLMPSVFPVLSYNLIADNLALPQLNEIAMYKIRPRLLQVPGVAQIQIQSAESREFAVEVDPERLSVLHLSLAQVATAVQLTNQVSVVGRSAEDRQQALIMGTGELFSVDQLKQVVVTSRGGTPITLGQIANVHEGSNDVLTAFSGSGKRAVLVSVIKQPTGNLLEIARAVNEELPRIQAQLPVGVKIQPVYDLAQLVAASIENLRDAIAFGVVLIFIVIFVFLRDWRSTFIAAATIPATVCVTFGIMALGHQTLNLMSLGGLAVAIGLVIDDAIVMIEGVFHNIQSGLSSELATARAVEELSGPIISSTITTVVVFAPLGLLEGVVGQFFIAFCYTLTSSVVVSLFLSLTLTPVMCGKFLRVSKPKKVLEKSDPKIKPAWQMPDLGKAVGRMLTHPRYILGVCLIMLICVIPISGLLERGFMPDIDEGSFVIDYYAPSGTSLADTDQIALRMEDILAEIKEVQSWSRRTGSQLGIAASATSQGDILVKLKPLAQRQRSTQQVMSEVREKLDKRLPGVDLELIQILQDLINDLADSPAPIAIKIYGNDEQVLKELSESTGKILQDIHGVVDVNSHVRPSATERTIRVDPIEAGRFGMTVSDILTQIQAALLGQTPTSVREQEKLIPVRVRYTDAVRKRYSEDLEAMPIFNLQGNVMPLKGLASIESKPGSMEIRRENLARMSLITAHLEGRDLGSAMDEVQAKMAKLKMPPGYYLAYGGQWASQQSAFLNLGLVLALAVILVYLVLVVQFHSLLTPIPILVAIPLSLFGVLTGLAVTHTPLNISSFMGIILLVGLVVKNGIILLTKVEQYQDEGCPIDESVAKAVNDRLRPILMTTICTLLGLVPLAFGVGSGAELQKPLAIAVIAGLSLSTLITLIVTPTLYKLIQNFEANRAEKKAAAKASQRSASPRID
ncbi:MAG: efflux RND transporter permease subunit [Cyanobacteria bacterium REEB67]|nr:efflux RND transporter permease subunit [Cyanobacteria bacterium REEB67]